ncbi:MAG: single-stranded DNA-binding protein [Planctomycetes bacterium]|nr:single-stranded DNA-binding protein [Planctomycetota bacterium]MCB9904304.1 single-stranded DNA-binding protein [Planctomycetota bacterium]
MSSYNKVILMGNLTRDPELRYTQSNMPICKIGLAVNRRFKDGQSGEWREEPTFVDVTIFGKRGEAFAKYHSKGKPAFIEGELRLDNWEDQQGQKRSKLYVVGNEWQFVGGGSGGGGGGSYSDNDYQDSGSSSQGGYGNYGGGQSGGRGGNSGGGQGQPSGGYLEVEDTPF